MQTRQLGPFRVSAIGLGAMPMSMGGNVKPDEGQAIATVHAALDAGVTYIDTADVYAPSWDSIGHNEKLIAKAVKSYGSVPDALIIGTKGGITRGEGGTWGRDGSLAHLTAAVEQSLKDLEVEVIDLYQWHRPDRWLVYGEVVEHFKTLQGQGKIRAVGLSNADVEEIDIAREVLGVGGLASVQNQFSPSYRGSQEELEHCAAHDITFLPWSPLGGTSGGATDVGNRFSVFADIGRDHGVSPQQVVLAWELSLSDWVIPIPGASRPASIIDSVAAADLQLDVEELALCSAAGTR